MGDMHDLLARVAESKLRQLLDVFPVAVVTGARQTGKSTLVQRSELSGDRPYLTLDDILVRDQARRDPELLLDRGDRLILDEVQHAPDLLLAIKRRVDQARAPGRYILTGSANLLIHHRVSESLAGRAGYLSLWPLTRREQLGLGESGVWSALLKEAPVRWPEIVASQQVPPEDWRALVRRGGYPVPAHVLSSHADRELWLAGYAATFLERDVGQISAIENLADLRRVITALCLRVGGLLNQAEVARDLGMPSSTVQRYLNLLELSYQLVRVPAYAVNRTKRLMKSPKVYWSDTGLAMHLSGEAEPRGQHLENLVLTDLLTWAESEAGQVSILHWRTSAGAEVDFVIERPNRLLPIEVKAARRVRHADARHLRAFQAEYADLAPAALLLYDGEESFWLDRNVFAVPWHRII
jgi:uncharacterized protein